MSKFNSGPAAADLNSLSSERLWLKHSLKHSQAWLPCVWKPPAAGQTQTWRIGRNLSICSRPLQTWLTLFILLQCHFHRYSKYYSSSTMILHFNCFPTSLSREPPRCNGTSKVSRNTHIPVHVPLNALYVLLGFTLCLSSVVLRVFEKAVSSKCLALSL